MYRFLRGSAMAQTSFIVDEETAKLLEELQKVFGVRTNAAVIRRALGLAKVAAGHVDKDNIVTIEGGARGSERVLLAG